MKTAFPKRWLSTVAAASLAAACLAATPVLAQSHDGGGHSADTNSHQMKGQGRSGGSVNRGGGMGHGSLRDVFQEMEDEAAAEHDNGTPGLDSGETHEAGSHDTGSAQGKKGQAAKESPTTHGSKQPADRGSATAKKGGGDVAPSVDEDSDRPEYAGNPGKEGKPGRPNTQSGTKKGDIYGDMYVIVRDDSGLPVLDADGYVQVKYLDASGNVVCCVLRDAEGNLLPTLADGTPVTPLEVELGRLSVGRSPTRVLSAQYEEAISSINTATAVSLDASGRIVLTLTDGTKTTIDSPLENLALYVELLNTGTLTGVDGANLGSLSFLVDGVLTAQDLEVAASFFAAASDKTLPITVDSVIYMNSILGIDGTLADNLVDYSTFTYNRESVYGSLTVDVLVLQPDGSYLPTTVNVYDAVFNSEPTGDLTNAAAFAEATDDARTVIDYLHEYDVPTGTN